MSIQVMVCLFPSSCCTLLQSLPEELLKNISTVSIWTTFFALPCLLRSGLGITVIFQFLAVWNDLLVLDLSGWSSVGSTTHDEAIKSGRFLWPDWHLLTAAAFISMFVPLVVFLSLQKYFVRGLMGGAVKG